VPATDLLLFIQKIILKEMMHEKLK